MPGVGGGGTILVGSSDKELKRLLPGFLAESFGRDVVFVEETSDFLLEILDKQVDLTIIDINLNGLPTAKTIQIFKKCRPRVPVIVLSDDYSVSTGSSIAEHGVFYYLYKPLELERLGEIVKSALVKRAREEAQERR